MDGWSEKATPVDQVIPPLNFAMVAPGVYRSGYPNTRNHSFLKALKLKTLIFLCPENCNQDNLSFCRDNGIAIMQFGIQGNKEPFLDIPESVRVSLTYSSLNNCNASLNIEAMLFSFVRTYRLFVMHYK